MKQQAELRVNEKQLSLTIYTDLQTQQSGPDDDSRHSQRAVIRYIAPCTLEKPFELE
jgi:hypothetical protein